MTASTGLDGKTPSQHGRDSYRPEVQGLRAVAVLMVAVYHIWFGRVSGGVDVFLLLTGFFITGSLVRMVERQGRVAFAKFWTRLLKRLAPAAGIVLLAILGGTYLVLPQSQWRSTIDEVVASALYYENWQLAANSVDYIAAANAASPTQHFWSLGIQGQFYIFWALVVGVVALVCARTRVRLSRALAYTALGLGAASLAYSLVITNVNQPWAYFDGGARLWELMAGALLALGAHLISPPRVLRVAMGWIGLIGLLSLGALLDVSALFPGIIAAWPIGAAALLIIAGTTNSRFGADRLLAWKPITYLGDRAYALYLWHWPLLIFFRSWTGKPEVTAAEGLMLMAISLVLAQATKWLAEDAVTWFTKQRRGPSWSLAIGAAALVPVLIATSASATMLDEQAKQRAELLNDPRNYPGAQVVDEPELLDDLPEVPMYPSLVDAEWDVPTIYTGGSDPLKDGPPSSLFGDHSCEDPGQFKMCEYGDEDAEHTIAIVGMSRISQWFTAIHDTAEKHGWRVLVLSKSSCQFTADTPMVDGEVQQSCQDWLDEAMEALDTESPDAAFTSSTLTKDSRQGTDAEYTPEGWVERWRELDDMDIDVIGVRDLPRLTFDPAECLSQKDRDCAEAASRTQAATDPATEIEDLPDNVELVDFTGYVCPDGSCDVEIGNVFVYRDYKHLTDTYVESMTPVMEKTLLKATGWG